MFDIKLPRITPPYLTAKMKSDDDNRDRLTEKLIKNSK